jgi:hypothetical protein
MIQKFIFKKEREKKYLSDIQVAIELIESFIQDSDPFESYWIIHKKYLAPLKAEVIK